MLIGLGSLIWCCLNILFVFQDGLTPLIIAALKGNKEICQLLIDRGASTTQLDKVKSLLLFLWYPQKRTHKKLYSETDCFAQDHHSVFVNSKSWGNIKLVAESQSSSAVHWYWYHICQSPAFLLKECKQSTLSLSIDVTRWLVYCQTHNYTNTTITPVLDICT